MNTVKMKTKKMLLVLPVLVIPFLTLAFWALGGGTGKKMVVTTMGLNPDLPDAALKEDQHMDKLSFYEKADKDSMKFQELIRNDPYFRKDSLPALPFPSELDELSSTTSNKYNQRLNLSTYAPIPNQPENQIMQQLRQLQEELNKPSPSAAQDETTSADQPALPNYSTPAEEDPDIQSLNGALDKILDIQHPDRVKERSLKNRQSAYAVRKDTGTDTLVNGFYSYSDPAEAAGENSIEAVIAKNQVIVNGAVVQLRILTNCYVNGKLIPADNLVSGIAALEGERLTIEINSIRCGKSIFNVKLEVYDMDGLPGIYIPGTINRDVAKESLNKGLSLADMTSIDPSLKAQATATGIGALKSLVSRKAKLVRVQVKAGYRVLLKNKNQNQ